MFQFQHSENVKSKCFITKSQKHVEAAEANQQTPESKALFFINKTT